MLPRANDVRRESVPPASSYWEPTAAAPTATLASRPIPPSAWRPICSLPPAARSILAETPEIYGAEQLLTRRAARRGRRKTDRPNSLVGVVHGPVRRKLDNNPSPGNKEGGLTTIYEKSLGAIAKGGTALTEVYHYAEPVTAKGFVVMDTPGLDPVSVTGIVAGGATVMVFTTGRGSCFGCKPMPSIKVATNTPMYERMIDDMDLDAGVILAGSSVERRRPESSTRSWPSPAAKRPRANTMASARRSSCRGPWGRNCRAPTATTLPLPLPPPHGPYRSYRSYRSHFFSSMNNPALNSVPSLAVNCTQVHNFL